MYSLVRATSDKTKNNEKRGAKGKRPGLDYLGNTLINKEQTKRLVTFETFDQSDEDI